MLTIDNEIRKDSINFQLNIYAVVQKKNLRIEVVNTTAHFLDDGNLLTTKWSSERRINAFSNTIRFLDDMTNGQFTP